MPLSILYARKQILPSRSAGVLQSMHMAAAFAQAGCRAYSYPGLKDTPPYAAGALSVADMLPLLEAYGLSSDDFTDCRPLPGSNKGLYGLLYRACLLHRYLSGCDIAYTRDVTDAGVIAQLRNKLGKARRERGIFLFEMHEILHAQHKAQGKAQNGRKTFRKEAGILSSVDGLVLINESLAPAVKELFGYTGPHIIEPSGFDPSFFAPLPLFSPENPWPRDSSPVYLLYIGNMHQNKGVEELIRAVGLLPARFRLRIAGSGSDAAVAAARALAASLGLEARITFMGHMPQKELRSACLGCHMAIVPQQTSEAYFSPIKLNEYMALGLPVIATPLPLFSALREALYQAESIAPASLAAAIVDLAANPERAATLREKGFAFAAAHSWQARAKRILEFAASLRHKRG